MLRRDIGVVQSMKSLLKPRVFVECRDVVLDLGHLLNRQQQPIGHVLAVTRDEIVIRQSILHAAPYAATGSSEPEACINAFQRSSREASIAGWMPSRRSQFSIIAVMAGSLWRARNWLNALGIGNLFRNISVNMSWKPVFRLKMPSSVLPRAIYTHNTTICRVFLYLKVMFDVVLSTLNT